MDGLKLLTPLPASSHLSEKPPVTARRGAGRIVIEHSAGRSRPIHLQGHSPLKLLAPETASPAAMIYVSTFGGGLVAGDDIRLQLTAGPRTTTFLGTQSATKIYRSTDGQACGQSLVAHLAEDATLIAWPDPLIPFANSSYQQEQSFHLTPTSSLILIDSQVAGRLARNERWAMHRFASRNRVTLANQPILNDTLLLDKDDGPIATIARTGRYNSLTTLFLTGPATQPWALALDAEIRATPPGRHPPLLCTTTRLRNNAGLLIRIASTDPRLSATSLRSALAPVTTILGADPWCRKW